MFFTAFIILSGLILGQPVQTIEEIHKVFTDSNYTLGDVENYIFIIENNPIDIENELSFIDKLNSSVEKDLLLSAISRKAEKYHDAYDLLIKHLNKPPNILEYYDKLVFAASASGKLSELKDEIDKVKSNSYYIHYLSGLYNYEAGKFKEAYKLFEEVSNSINHSIVYYHIAYTQRSLGEYNKAFNSLQKCIKLSGKNDAELSKYIIAQGSLLYLSDKRNEAREYYDRGLKEAESAGNVIEKINALVNKGILLDDAGSVYDARDLFLKAIELGDKIKSPPSSAFANSEMGVSYTLTNELSDAQKHYKISYELYKRLNNRTRLAFISYNLGNLKMNFADYNSALKYFNEGLDYSGENIRAQIQNITGLADVYHNLSDFSKSLKYYKKAEELAIKIDDVQLQAEIKIGMGSLFFNLEQPQKALNIFKEAEDLINNNDYPFLKSEIFHKIGITYTELNEYNLAEKYLEYSIRISSSTGDIQSNLLAKTDLAFLYAAQNETRKAQSQLNTIMPISEQYWFYNLLGMQKLILADIYKNKGVYKKALELYREAERIGNDNFNSDLKIESDFQSAQIFMLLNQKEEAENYYLNAVNTINTVSNGLTGNSDVQISYFSNYKEIYDGLINLYLSAQKYDKAFLTIESSRSRNTLQNLKNIKLNSLIANKEEIQKIYELEWMLNSEIYESSELDSIKAELKNLKESLISENPSAAEYISFRGESSINDFQKALSEKENLISIYVSNNFSQYFIISGESFTSGRINVNREELKELVRAISPYFNPKLDKEEIYYNQDLFSFNAEASYNLYQKFFAELLSNVHKNESIIFNLPTELITLPLEFLVTEYISSYSPYNYGNKTFLISDYPISYTPSFRIYLEQKQLAAGGSSDILLLGNPAFQNASELYGLRRGLLDNNDVYTRVSTLYPLNYSQDEVEEIENLADNTTILLSDDATETNFKLNASHKRIIHLSTHTFQYKNQPLVVFSNINDEKNDGLLEAGEIVNLNLSSDLVVLSSCRSGLGEIDKAEGIIGMQKAFFEAGAKSLVVSLWDVSDKYTAKFMTAFYSQLSSGKSKSEALRSAKIEFMNKYSANPYYWSAFVLYGNEDVVPLEHTSSYFYFVILLLAGIIITAIIYIYRRNS